MLCIILYFKEKGFCIRGELCPYDHGNDPVVIQDMPMQGMMPGFPSQPPFIHGNRPMPGMPVAPPLLGVPPPNLNQPPPPVSKSSSSEASKTEEEADLPKGTVEIVFIVRLCYFISIRYLLIMMDTVINICEALLPILVYHFSIVCKFIFVVLCNVL